MAGWDVYHNGVVMMPITALLCVMWRYGAPPMLTGEHVMGAFAGGAL